MFFYLHEFDHSSPKKTEASKLTANHVGLTPKKEKTEQDLFYGVSHIELDFMNWL